MLLLIGDNVTTVSAKYATGYELHNQGSPIGDEEQKKGDRFVV